MDSICECGHYYTVHLRAEFLTSDDSEVGIQCFGTTNLAPNTLCKCVKFISCNVKKDIL